MASMEMASGRRFRFGFADELGLHHGFGITVHEVRVIDKDAGPLSDVTDSWPTFRPITGASVPASCTTPCPGRRRSPC